jgi:hypothetical protein
VTDPAVTDTSEPDWTETALDRWRGVTDGPADAAVAEYFAAVGPAAGPDRGAPGALFGALVASLHLPPEDQVPAIAAFLREQSTLPPWADPARVRRGQDFFSDLVLHQFTALYLASLPNAYAAAAGVHVIWLTGRLQHDLRRRLNETAQFLMDVSAPGSFEDGSAVDRILHVRLMHAAIRWLVGHDPRVERPAVADPAPLPDGLLWAESWGSPVNQEDLAGTALTFTTVVLDAFERSGVEYTAEQAADFLHLWQVIAAMLGVAPELIPSDLAAARRLQEIIFTRQHARSAVGVALTATLLDLVRERLPRPVAALAAPMLRRFVGDTVADLLDVPTVRGAEPILAVLVALTKVLTAGRRDDPVPRWLSRWVGRHLVDGLLAADRKGERVPFAIPERLAAQSADV